MRFGGASPSPSAMKTKYVQCELKKGNSCQVTKLPEEFAVEGITLKLRDKDKKWDDGWVVSKVYPGVKFIENIDDDEGCLVC